ncbi:hypothetical protein [Terracoccus sp. 273MFTsu3.1]|uniref:hypothetical protein n=1 Tax=Terracoccus sp. 273MFTsu3.1 TaxID=1172188 RepID=UPI00039984FE|nr:hypothetical protein [Terracoccus sp. 273MFTsu3.1]
MLSQSASELGVDVDPRVLGPLAAFVFLIFTFEVVVSGKAYKREVEENARLREMNAKIIPVAEEMVSLSKKMIEVTDSTGKALEDFVAWWTTESSTRWVGR